MTDLVIFAVLFACFIVLHENTFNGPSAKELFHLPSVLAETLILLTSSFTCSLGMLAVHRQLKNWAIIWFISHFFWELPFFIIEISEFVDFVEKEPVGSAAPFSPHFLHWWAHMDFIFPWDYYGWL